MSFFELWTMECLGKNDGIFGEFLFKSRFALITII